MGFREKIAELREVARITTAARGGVRPKGLVEDRTRAIGALAICMETAARSFVSRSRYFRGLMPEAVDVAILLACQQIAQRIASRIDKDKLLAEWLKHEQPTSTDAEQKTEAPTPAPTRGSETLQ